jgi:hypothetical protein
MSTAVSKIIGSRRPGSAMKAPAPNTVTYQVWKGVMVPNSAGVLGLQVVIQEDDVVRCCRNTEKRMIDTSR